MHEKPSLRYLELEPVDWIEKFSKDYQRNKSSSDSAAAKVWQTAQAAKNTKINAVDYVGIYQDKWFGKIEIFLRENQLWFKSYRSPKLMHERRFQANAGHCIYLHQTG